MEREYWPKTKKWKESKQIKVDKNENGQLNVVSFFSLMTKEEGTAE